MTNGAFGYLADQAGPTIAGPVQELNTATGLAGLCGDGPGRYR
jgi:hypothetical protein